jgi:hypothetical protein
MYQYVPEPTGTFWDELTPWNDAIVTSVHAMWTACAALVSAVLRMASQVMV